MRHHKRHEWGVIAQCHVPYREFHYCPLCRQYNESGARPYISKGQFALLKEQLKDNNPMYYPDSAIQK